MSGSRYAGISYEDAMRLAHLKFDFLRMQRSIERRSCEVEGVGVFGLRNEPEIEVAGREEGTISESSTPLLGDNGGTK